MAVSLAWGRVPFLSGSDHSSNYDSVAMRWRPFEEKTLDQIGIGDLHRLIAEGVEDGLFQTHQEASGLSSSRSGIRRRSSLTTSTLVTSPTA